MNRSQRDFAEQLFRRELHSGYDNLTGAERTYFDIAMGLSFMQGCEDFGTYFESGFCAESLCESLERIGHRSAAITVRFAHRIYNVSPFDDALSDLGRAFCQMEESITAKLEIFQVVHIP